MKITVVARSWAKAGCEAAWEAALRAVVAPTHGEKGCLKYTLQRGVGAPGKMVVLERWESQAHLDAHLKAPHIKALFAKAKTLVGESDITVYEELAEGELGKGRF